VVDSEPVLDKPVVELVVRERLALSYDAVGELAGRDPRPDVLTAGDIRAGGFGEIPSERRARRLG
jgi:hypothetical protein